MNEKFMKFVHQCQVRRMKGSVEGREREILNNFCGFLQYFEDEGMDLVKVGKLIPQPKYNLVFDYGKVNFWPGK